MLYDVVSIDACNRPRAYGPRLRDIEIKTGAPAYIGIQPALEVTSTGTDAYENGNSRLSCCLPKSPLPDGPVEHGEAASDNSPCSDFYLLPHDNRSPSENVGRIFIDNPRGSTGV